MSQWNQCPADGEEDSRNWALKKIRKSVLVSILLRQQSKPRPSNSLPVWADNGLAALEQKMKEAEFVER